MSESFGLDLGTSSLKLVGLSKTKTGFEVTALSIIANPLGRLVINSPDEQVQLVAAIKSLIKNARVPIQKVSIGLAESQVFTRVIQVPILSEAELASSIRWEAEQHVPIPLSEVQLDYTVLSRPDKSVREGTMDVLLVAAKRTAINQVVDLAKFSGIELSGIETSILGSIRALSGPEDPPTLLMCIGASSSDFAVVSKGKLVLTYSAPTAGSSLTRSLETELELSAAQAEQYKRTYGMNTSLLEGRVRQALLGVFSAIMSEAKKAINAYESVRSGQKIQRIVLSGGTALLPDISKEVSNALGVPEVMTGSPFYLMSTHSGVSIPIEATVYAVATGLARGAL